MLLRTPPTKRPRLPASPPDQAGEQSLALVRPLHRHPDDPLHGDGAELLDCTLPEPDGMQCSYRCHQMVKSELLQTLDIQERRILELSSQTKSLQDSLHMAEMEKQDLMESVKRLKQVEAASTAREKAVQAKYISEVEHAEERIRVQLERCNDLQLKLQQEMQHRAEAEHKADAAESQVTSMKDAADKADEASRREILQLKERLQRVQKEADSTLARTKIESSAEKSCMQFDKAEVQALKCQIEDLQRLLANRLNEKRELAEQLARAPSQNSSSKNEELETLVKNLQEELKSFESDVAEARKMKHFHVNANLLREKLETERQRADRAEAELGRIAELQLQIQSLEQELQSWRNLLHEIPDVERREDIPRKIGQLQRESVSAMAKAGELAAQVQELQAQVIKLQAAPKSSDLASVESLKKVTQDEREVEEMALTIKRLERKIHLLIKERDGLKSIIASYDEEEAMMKTHSRSSDLVQMLDTPQKAKEKRIQEMEALIQDLQREGDLLRSDLTKAEMKLGRGDYDPSCTKVVRMIENLDVNAEKQVLLSEIQNLREKVEFLQNNNAITGNLDAKNTEVSALKEQVTSLEKREARYRKIFAEKISLFRQACCLLFGYTVEMSEEQQLSTGMTVTLFTLQSIYAQSEDEKLAFQFESNHMNLLANDYTSTPEIARMVEVYLQRFNCIPAFTANLTSELFNKTTLG